MLTKEDKTLIKMSGNQKRNGACVVLRTFRSDSEQLGPLNEHPVVDVRARPALLRT